VTERIGYKEARKLLAKPAKKQSKFRNKPFWEGGIYWHSRREYERWLFLQARERAREISELRRQVRFDLHVNGIKIGRYNADFSYKLDGQLVIEDVKAAHRAGQRSATATALYQRSRRHLKAEYGIDIVEV
jgi:hypothetical protein